MQTPKASRNGTTEMPQRTSPSSKSSQKSSPSTNRIARSLKVAGSGSVSIGSPNSLSRTPKKRSPKVLDRGSPRSPMTQKHPPSKLSELESQLAQLDNEFKRAKEQLSSSESQKQRAQQEAEETKKQLSVLKARLEDSQHQLIDLSNSEDSRVQELRKLSQERDRVWQSELEAIQKQHSMDSSALASALNEIQKLKKQLKYAEVENLREKLSETFSMVDNMRKQVDECKSSEAHALEVSREAQMQLEETMKNAESLHHEGVKAKEAYNSMVTELEQSKAEVASLENMVRKLKEDLKFRTQNSSKDEADELKSEIESLKHEVAQLRSSLEASEVRYEQEYIQSTLQIRTAYDQVEQAKSEYSAKEAEYEAELKKAKDTIEELKSEIMNKESTIHSMLENNKETSRKIEENDENIPFDVEVKKLREEVDELRLDLLDKEARFQHTSEENEKLKAELQKRGTEAAALAEAAEKEALAKLGCVTEEADKSTERVARVAQQLDSAQAANAELEGELRRLKVQSDQWRKAAEAAANMLSNGTSRTVSFENGYNSLAAKMGSPLSDDMEDDSPKKKNGNMLKKIGVLWKKGQK